MTRLQHLYRAWAAIVAGNTHELIVGPAVVLAGIAVLWGVAVIAPGVMS